MAYGDRPAGAYCWPRVWQNPSYPTTKLLPKLVRKFARLTKVSTKASCAARIHRRRAACVSRTFPHPEKNIMTRIASVTAHPISAPMKQVLWTAHEELKASTVILVEIRTDDGLAGYGQIHGSPMKTICEWIAKFGELIRGMDALGHV